MINCSINFTIEDKTGALNDALDIFKKHKISLRRIESRPSKNFEWEYEFTVDVNVDCPELLNTLQHDLAMKTKNVSVISISEALNKSSANVIPWFPRRMTDLDSFAVKTLEYGAELSADHPGFTDDAYRKRRAEITAKAKTFRTGMSISRIEYIPEEIDTWRQVYTKLQALYPTHACREHRYVFPLLEQNCGYGPNKIPQLEDVSNFLKECTGFTLRPVMGLLSPRDFLNGLAFRVFHATQYVRHHSKPFYTPEPDVCHELLGHAPLFADPEFAAFSQEIGLASLGASDEDIVKLGSIYWFTVEFGLCKEESGEIRAYGAGLLSSFGELEYALTKEPKLQPFECAHIAETTFPITTYQPTYFVADSFPSAQQKIREYAATLKRPFTASYNPYTQTIQILDTKEKILRYASNIGNDIQVLVGALGQLQ